LQITGATLGELSGLVARVLLRRTSAGRYVMHELLRQFVAAKLDESVEINANAPHERHSRYYLDWAIRHAPALESADLPQALTALRTELANLRVAWQWATHQQQHELLADSVDILTDFYEASGLLAGVPGIVVEDDLSAKQYPQPRTASGRDAVFVGRIREDISCPNGIALWCVSDNLRKGAATNAVQIAEHLAKHGLKGAGHAVRT
jgi:hypothetical protein